MAEEPEYYKAQPLPPRDGASQGGHGAPTRGYGTGPAAPGWGQGYAQRPVVNVVGGRSALLAYVLWFFLGWLGIHKFYLLQPFQGVLYLMLWGFGVLTAGIFIGWFPLGLWVLLMLVDIFVIPLRVAQLNARLARRAHGPYGY